MEYAAAAGGIREKSSARLASHGVRSCPFCRATKQRKATLQHACLHAGIEGNLCRKAGTPETAVLLTVHCTVSFFCCSRTLAAKHRFQTSFASSVIRVIVLRKTNLKQGSAVPGRTSSQYGAHLQSNPVLRHSSYVDN